MKTTLDHLSHLIPKEDLQALAAIKGERLPWRNRPQWEEVQSLLEKLPTPVKTMTVLNEDVVSIQGNISSEEKETILQCARKMIPWKKGPYSLFGEEIDAEWRSDIKWNRIREFIGDIEGKNVLDIGCNNGYFMFRLAALKPNLVLGIDPVIPFESQFRLINHFARQDNLKFELFGVEHLKHMKNVFDLILHMGIIYHHKNPIDQLIDVRESLRPGGQAIIETIGIPGDSDIALSPRDRYANMKNVYFIPTLNCLKNWATKANLVDIETVFHEKLTSDEQRRTNWCPEGYPSLSDFLDPNDPSKTIEGYEAPMRFAISVRRKS